MLTQNFIHTRNLPIDQTSLERRFKRRTFLEVKPDYFWKIESGIVRTLTWNDRGKVITLGIWGKGDIVGSALSATTPYEIECLTSVKAKLVPNIQLATMIEAILCQLRQTEEFLKIVKERPMELSILRLLNWLANRFGQAGAEGHTIEVLLTHQEIAEIVGTTRVTASRIISDLTERGIIVRHDRHFVITLDRDPFWHYEI